MPKDWADRIIMFSVIGLVAWGLIGLPAMEWTLSPRSQPADNPTHQQTADGFHEDSAWLTKDAAGFLTFGLVVVGTFQIGLFLWQLWLIRESLIDAKIAAEAAKESADAAKEGAHAARDSAEIARTSMVASDRAYIHHTGFRWISHRDPADGHVFWRIRPQWTNAGNTPPRQLHVYAHYEVLDHELPANYTFIPNPTAIADARPAMIAPKGMIDSAARDTDGKELVAIRDGKKFFYVWGVARYRDVFPETPERITKFCAFIDMIAGNPLEEWDTKTNNVELRFVAYHRHNCADEDCETEAATAARAHTARTPTHQPPWQEATADQLIRGWSNNSTIRPRDETSPVRHCVRSRRPTATLGPSSD
jgi:hypothetical protein